MFFQRKTAAQQINELRASRREIVHAFEIERRRIERDLHDGAQQYLVAANMAVGEAQMILQMCIEKLRSVQGGENGSQTPDCSVLAECVETDLLELSHVLTRAQDAGRTGLRAIRETVNNIHPHLLSDMGLEAAVRGVVEASNVAARVVVPHRLPVIPDGVATTAYFFVCEALTNIAKYAPAAQATVLLAVDQNLRISVVDNGPGGVIFKQGHGLIGLRERLAAFGGELTLDSPPGGPTTLLASIPLLLNQGESGIVK